MSISAPIMSRFDLFFVIVDECQASIDENIARHIVDNHRAGGRAVQRKQVPFSVEELQRYIRFARTINPVLTPESRAVLVTSYRLLRQNDILGKNKTSYRITVRQLESLVRLSEALARLHLDHYVQAVHVKEAYRLLQKSIIFVETEDVELEDIEEELNNTDVDQAVIDDLLAGVEEPSEISSPGDAAHEQTEAEDGVTSLREQSGVLVAQALQASRRQKSGTPEKPASGRGSSNELLQRLWMAKRMDQSVRRSMRKIRIHSKVPLHWQQSPRRKRKRRKRCWQKSITVSQR